jgi:hypothetical protein
MSYHALSHFHLCVSLFATRAVAIIAEVHEADLSPTKRRSGSAQGGVFNDLHSNIASGSRTKSLDGAGQPTKGTAADLVDWERTAGRRRTFAFVEALPGVGVIVTRIEDFFSREPQGTPFFKAVVAAPSALRVGASKLALTRKGASYANDFEPPSSGKYYCSSLVDEAYRDSGGSSGIVFIDRTFTMLFVPLEFWTQYYEAMNMSVPVNATGSNPTLLLHSPIVTFAAIGEARKAKL